MHSKSHSKSKSRSKSKAKYTKHMSKKSLGNIGTLVGNLGTLVEKPTEVDFEKQEQNLMETIGGMKTPEEQKLSSLVRTKKKKYKNKRK